jgi:hypothetical protein
MDEAKEEGKRKREKGGAKQRNGKKRDVTAAGMREALIPALRYWDPHLQKPVSV